MKHNKNTTLLVFLLHFRFFNILYCQNRLIQNKNRNFVAQVRCRKALTANLENEINLTHKIKYQTIMKKYVAIALSLFTAIAFTSCKSQESAYKKAYEKAKQQQTVEQQQPQQTTVAVQPTQPATTVTTTPAPTHADANVRSESVQLIDGAGLKTYSVVCGSFSLKANAQGLQQKPRLRSTNCTKSAAQVLSRDCNHFRRSKLGSIFTQQTSQFILRRLVALQQIRI